MSIILKQIGVHIGSKLQEQEETKDSYRSEFDGALESLTEETNALRNTSMQSLTEAKDAYILKTGQVIEAKSAAAATFINKIKTLTDDNGLTDLMPEVVAQLEESKEEVSSMLKDFKEQIENVEADRRDELGEVSEFEEEMAAYNGNLSGSEEEE